MREAATKSPAFRGLLLAGFAAALLFPIPHARADAECPGRYTADASTVTDNDTHLVWQRVVDGGTYSWVDAKAYCQSLALAGGGWRTPAVFELLTILDDTGPYPSIDPLAFPGTPAEAFWSSSPYAPDPKHAWRVFFSLGYADWAVSNSAFSVNDPLRVRCVR